VLLGKNRVARTILRGKLQSQYRLASYGTIGDGQLRRSRTVRSCVPGGVNGTRFENMSLAFNATSRSFAPMPVSTGWRSQLHVLAGRLRYQLLGALTLGALLPAVARTQLDLAPPGTTTSVALAAFGAIALAFWAQRRIAAYPGVNAQAAVLPLFGVAMAVGAAAFWFFGSTPSLVQFALGMLAAGSCVYAVTGLRQMAQARLLLVRSGYAYRHRPARDGRRWPVANVAAQLWLPLGGEAATENALPDDESVEWVVARSTFDASQNVDGVVADLAMGLPKEWEQLVARWALDGIPVYDAVELGELMTGKVAIDRLSEVNLVSRMVSAVYMVVKQVVDTVVAIAVIPLVLLIWVGVAVAIKLDDGGSVVFAQRRMGFRGKPFTMLKFRTMREDLAGQHSTSRDDPRITRVGRILRRFRIDEVPQVVNILRGEMSWIGPRPEPLSLAEWYQRGLRFYEYRHTVRPGITGWAQVNQGYVEADIIGGRGKLHHDFYYIKNFSPWLDLLISARTVLVAFNGHGAR
jgi:lipopolysaccharide/colanic/teichoic acid biosynthesis glycosyltransferase